MFGWGPRSSRMTRLGSVDVICGTSHYHVWSRNSSRLPTDNKLGCDSLLVWKDQAVCQCENLPYHAISVMRTEAATHICAFFLNVKVSNTCYHVPRYILLEWTMSMHST